MWISDIQHMTMVILLSRDHKQSIPGAEAKKMLLRSSLMMRLSSRAGAGRSTVSIGNAGQVTEVSRRDKDIIGDQCRTTHDRMAKMIFDKDTGRLEPINASNPTPRLDVEINRDNMVSYIFNALPDTSSTRAVVAKNVAEDMGLKWDPMTYNHVLTDAQGRRMAVEGLTIIKVCGWKTE